MDTELPQKRSHLFTMRIWYETGAAENEDEETGEWRGRIYLSTTDEIRHFREWASLIPTLLSMLKNAGAG